MTATELAATAVAVIDVEASAPGAGLYRLATAARAGRPVRVVVHGDEVSPADLASATGVARCAVSQHGETPGVGARMAPPDDVVAWIAAALATLAGARARPRWTDRLDTLLTRPTTGLPAFLVVVAAFFQLVGLAVGPSTDLAARAVGALASAVGTRLPGWPSAALVDGVLVGVETVLALLPIVALSFAVIGLLDASGLMARAVVVSDKALRHIGLDGAMAASLVLGFGCNVPGVAAAGKLERPRDRVLAASLVPYASCSARLTVYVYLAHAAFPGHVGLVVACVYAANAVIMAAGGWAASRFTGRCVRVPSLVLPEFARPSWRAVALPVARESWSFLTRTGPVIVAALTALWLLTAIPTGPGRFAEVEVADSVAGSLADAIAPAMAPMGLDDPHVATGLIGAIAAKEVVIGVLAAGADGASADQAILATLEASSGGHPGAAAAALMVLLMTAVPCVATLAMQRRVMGMRATAATTGIHLAASWLLAVGVFQVAVLL